MAYFIKGRNEVTEHEQENLSTQQLEEKTDSRFFGADGDQVGSSSDKKSSCQGAQATIRLAVLLL